MAGIVTSLFSLNIQGGPQSIDSAIGVSAPVPIIKLPLTVCFKNRKLTL